MDYQTLTTCDATHELGDGSCSQIAGHTGSHRNERGQFWTTAEEAQAASEARRDLEREHRFARSLVWTALPDQGFSSRTYLTPLPRPFTFKANSFGHEETASHVSRWYNGQERSWVVAYSDAEGVQQGSSTYVATKDEAILVGGGLVIRAATQMGETQQRLCGEWLDRVADYGSRGYERASLAAEVVRGIASVTDPEFIAGLVRFGTPVESDWVVALQTYGPTDQGSNRARARRLVQAVAGFDHRAAREAVL